MNSDFEKRLQDQPMRAIPRHWRAEILRAATRKEQPRMVERFSSWLWPHPRAWAGLAAAWIVIFFLHFTAPENPPLARNSSPITFQSLALMEQETLAIARSLDPNDPGEPPAVTPAPPMPRSEKRRKQLIG
jgi:hypothetical protein